MYLNLLLIDRLDSGPSGFRIQPRDTVFGYSLRIHFHFVTFISNVCHIMIPAGSGRSISDISGFTRNIPDAVRLLQSIPGLLTLRR